MLARARGWMVMELALALALAPVMALAMERRLQALP
jgi:hypothetical protein